MKFKLIALIFLIVAVAGCAQQAAVAPVRTNEVSTEGFKFEPSNILVNVGDTVTWSQNHDVVHTIVSLGLFESEVLKNGDQFSWKFTDMCTYDYYCSIHPSMRGSVIVE